MYKENKDLQDNNLKRFRINPFSYMFQYQFISEK